MSDAGLAGRYRRRRTSGVSIGGFDLNLLPTLSALLEERNVTRAAERLSLGQPAVSAALARLRRHYDDPLLVRQGRVYRLSSLAEALVEPVREAMTSVEHCVSTPRGFDPALDARSFTLAASDYFSTVFLRPLLGQLAREAPGVRLQLVPIRSGLDEALRRGSIDLALLPTELATAMRDLERQVLYREHFVLMADRDHPALAQRDELDSGASGGAAIDLALLQRLPFVMFAGELPFVVGRRLQEQGIELRVDVTTEGFVAAPLLLPGTELVTFVPERLARMVAEPIGLAMYASPVDIGEIVEAMYWSPRRTEDAAHRWLRTRITAEAQRLA
ncbi:MAG TPA: LysR substrate-binding domain-containing protein [Nakamurella sp.]|nr:LysR substrate-binding domain-containing protein [Nakamurella sp.]